MVKVIKVVVMKVVIVAGGEFLKPPCEWSSIVCPSLVALSVEQGPAENKCFKWLDFYNLKSIYGWLLAWFKFFFGHFWPSGHRAMCDQ